MLQHVPLRGLWLLALFWLGGSLAAWAQTRITLSGTVVDATSGENLTGATVRVRELSSVGTGANAYGFYTLTVPAGTYTLEASFVGYAPQQRQLTVSASQRLDFKLQPGGSELNEVVVTGRAADANISRAQMGVEQLDLKQIAKVPVLFGEKDVIKTLTLLPGIKSAGEGSRVR
ncbi:MAG: carboxypeptidase-like regulatory domain-containing protein, partial [Hymenobacter sp.]